MINRVKYLQEELARHDGDLYLSQHIDVVKRGANVAIEFAGMRDTTEFDDLDERCDELIDCIQAIDKNIKSLCDEPTAENYKDAIEIIKGLIIDSEAT